MNITARRGSSRDGRHAIRGRRAPIRAIHFLRWTFQYFAWSMVLWMLLPWRSALATHLAGGAFVYVVYVVYAYVCHDPWLLSAWQFGAYAAWPAWLIVCRDTANLVFLAVGMATLVRAMAAVRRARMARR